jgi:hypothetical protein
MKTLVSVKVVAAVTLFVAANLLARPADGADRAIHAEVPSTIDLAARYLFHMHGRAIEVQGPVAKTPWGAYLYNDVVGAFADRGFVVISEVRPPTTQLAPYATTVAGQVAKLLSAGVPPENITVTGFSKGGAIAVLATATIGNPRVSYVVLAGCLLAGGGRTPADLTTIGRPQGRIFSIYDEGDTEAGSCASNFADKPGVTFKETVTHEGRGHGLFLTPNNVWLDPVVNWALRR